MKRIGPQAHVLASTMVLVWSSPCHAAELQLHLGGLRGPDAESTYSWALEYRRPLTENLSASFTWLNEGHIPTHHRDGQAVQLWWHTAPPRRGLTFEAGLGPYFYFDTTLASNADGYTNAHGRGLLGSIGAVWQLDENRLGSLRLNRVQVQDGIHTTALVAGLAYRFDSVNDRPSSSRAAARKAGPRSVETDAMLGATIVNSFDSDAAPAGALALRVRANKNMALSLAYLDEGNLDTGTSHPGRRAGVAPQIWLEDDLTGRFSMGIGIGPYFATRKPQAPEGESASTVSGLVSFTLAYAISPEWTGRLIWNRVATDYDRNTDVVTFGLGYRF